MAIRHRWTFAEDKLCCQRYVEAYVIQQQDLPLSEFIRGLSAELPQIQPSSLRMKAQNIKQILLVRHIPDTLSSAPSANYSRQNWDAMTCVLEEANLLPEHTAEKQR